MTTLTTGENRWVVYRDMPKDGAELSADNRVMAKRADDPRAAETAVAVTEVQEYSRYWAVLLEIELPATGDYLLRIYPADGEMSADTMLYEELTRIQTT
jgi:hypothetical protein